MSVAEADLCLQTRYSQTNEVACLESTQMFLLDEECVPGVGSISPHTVFPAVNELRLDLFEACLA